jgi:hypothetical protein
LTARLNALLIPGPSFNTSLHESLRLKIEIQAVRSGKPQGDLTQDTAKLNDADQADL